ncbi:hypothetical protein [Maricaulis maris]|uniref:Secreted protein n=1 Tax=Maricaulis maris TaxID=74318 RepID=A0A495DM31_9PROT|nr:hypothetical protein [Maricaulis maris]RKR03964.1 hypothetical protein C7435_0407 [Maricaulis maris]
MMKTVIGTIAAIMMAGAPALAIQDDVTTPTGRTYSVAGGGLAGSATIRFSDEGEFRPDGAGGRDASGSGYYSLDETFCTAHVEISWRIHVNSDGTAMTTLETSENACARAQGMEEVLRFGYGACEHGWDDLQPGETGSVCWAGVEVTREN